MPRLQAKFKRKGLEYDTKTVIQLNSDKVSMLESLLQMPIFKEAVTIVRQE